MEGHVKNVLSWFEERGCVGKCSRLFSTGFLSHSLMTVDKVTVCYLSTASISIVNRGVSKFWGLESSCSIMGDFLAPICIILQD
jgi:hypothetical protein